ncbi:hypothetical protein [Winogradskyella thalassocola]|uniref:SGNH/GDSL hydrolase family protein n=1 Tax=Winogradskyella thalassocola TaxID=262004 RepID=A0A1G8FV61_9FLAO|nr:hypothetical protein [Winogradskyella thalassocola]SDH86005.1 hypothetical protein SAMN04489796_1053 [Winogradskyella thalassocola]
MSVFIKRILLFTVLLLGLIVLTLMGASSLDRKSTSFKLQNNPKHIVLGHSQPECAFNDSLIPSLKNLSQSGDSYFYIYFKTKEVIKQNPALEVVFIEFTDNQLNMNENIWSNKYIPYKYPKYSSFMSMTDKLVLFKNNPSAFINVQSLSLKMKLTRSIKNELYFSNDYGDYFYLERDKTDSLVKNLSGVEDIPFTVDNEVSEVNLSYLDAIIKLCEENGKKVILIRSPLHKKYHESVNEENYYEILKTRYGTMDYMDFSNFPLSNSQYGDLQHVNHKGAKVFSEWFAMLLQNGLLEKENKQDFINDMMLDKIKE